MTHDDPVADITSLTAYRRACEAHAEAEIAYDATRAAMDLAGRAALAAGYSTEMLAAVANRGYAAPLLESLLGPERAPRA